METLTGFFKGSVRLSRRIPLATCKYDTGQTISVSSHCNRHVNARYGVPGEPCAESPPTAWCFRHLAFHLLFLLTASGLLERAQRNTACHITLLQKLVGWMRVPGPSARGVIIGETKLSFSHWKSGQLGWLRATWSLLYRESGVPESYTWWLFHNREVASDGSNFSENSMVIKKTNTKQTHKLQKQTQKKKKAQREKENFNRYQ